MRDHDHSSCHGQYVLAIDEIIYSLREGCDWVGHSSAIAERGWCPQCQH